MPGGIPVATVAIGGAKNAGLLAVSILGGRDAKLLTKMIIFKRQLAIESRERSRKLQASLNK
jgi:5-(carboxyamino)imidazole ribonucleotide mutase